MSLLLRRQHAYPVRLRMQCHSFGDLKLPGAVRFGWPQRPLLPPAPGRKQHAFWTASKKRPPALPAGLQQSVRQSAFSRPARICTAAIWREKGHESKQGTATRNSHRKKPRRHAKDACLRRASGPAVAPNKLQLEQLCCLGHFEPLGQASQYSPDGSK